MTRDIIAELLYGLSGRRALLNLRRAARAAEEVGAHSLAAALHEEIQRRDVVETVPTLDGLLRDDGGPL